MTNKVYTGTTSIEEHIKQLDMDGWVPHAERNMSEQVTEYRGLENNEPPPKRMQSIEIQRLKREAGLV